MSKRFQQLDTRIAGFMGKYSHLLLRMSLGVVFIWFGILKPLGLSPAALLVEQTVYWALPPKVFVSILGWWEVAIGVCFLVPRWNRIALGLLALHMPGTFLPLLVAPELCFQQFPFVLTLEGQYIIKNLVLVSGALAIAYSLLESRHVHRSTAAADSRAAGPR